MPLVHACVVACEQLEQVRLITNRFVLRVRPELFTQWAGVQAAALACESDTALTGRSWPRSNRKRRSRIQQRSAAFQLTHSLYETWHSFSVCEQFE
eukprot:2320740-Rhodomonas_salina.1